MRRITRYAALPLALVTIGALAACSSSSDEQASGDYPTKPINLTVPYDAGGNLDTIARSVTQCMEDELGQRILVQNKSGAAGTIGTAEVANATPDGYTIGISPVGPVALTPGVVDTVNYTAASFDYFGYVSNPPMLIITSKDAPYDTLSELVEAAQDESVVTVTPGANSLQALFARQLNSTEGTQLELVQTDSAIEILRGVANGDYAVGVTTVSAEVLPQIENGDVKALSHSGTDDYQFLQEVPTFEDEGYGDILPMAMLPSALIAPHGVPDEVKTALSGALETCIEDPDVIERVGAEIIAPSYTPGDQVREDWIQVEELAGDLQ